MTIIEMANYFDIMQDKFKSPYFTDTEKTLFLQRAHVDLVNNLLSSDEKLPNVELSQDTISKIATLIIPLAYINMPSTGVVLKSSIQTALNTASSGAVLWRPLNIGWVLGNESHPVKYTRHNDWWEFKQNYFKNPSTDNPKVYETATGYQFGPIHTNAKLYFNVLKYPKKVVIDSVTPANNVDSDLPDFTHDEIVALALEYAGIGSRDENLAQLLQIKK